MMRRGKGGPFCDALRAVVAMAFTAGTTRRFIYEELRRMADEMEAVDIKEALAEGRNVVLTPLQNIGWPSGKRMLIDPPDRPIEPPDNMPSAWRRNGGVPSAGPAGRSTSACQTASRCSVTA